MIPFSTSFDAANEQLFPGQVGMGALYAQPFVFGGFSFHGRLFLFQTVRKSKSEKGDGFFKNPSPFELKSDNNINITAVCTARKLIFPFLLPSEI